MNEFELPATLPILSHGKGASGSGKVCAEQAISWLVSGEMDLFDESDHPECVQPVLNQLAIAINDLVPDSTRIKMWPSLLRQIGTARPEMEPGLSEELADFVGAWNEKTDVGYADVEVDGWWYEYLLGPDGEMLYDEFEGLPLHDDSPVCSKRLSVSVEVEYTYQPACECDDCQPTTVYADNGECLLELLTLVQDECERLTGHVPAACDLKRVERLGELVGVSTVNWGQAIEESELEDHR
jgi:hypothetical protein